MQWGDEKGRLSQPLFAMVEAIDTFNATKGPALEQRLAAWAPVQDALKQATGAEVKCDSFRGSLTIFQAGAFALDWEEAECGVRFSPILMARSKAPTLEDDAPDSESGGGDPEKGNYALD